MKITIINGPNMNILGSREKNIYGDRSFESFLGELEEDFPEIDFGYVQSNIEGEIINSIYEAASSGKGIILNAAGYTHTSVAIADAVRSVNVPVLEVHISNILAREEYRHVSLIAPACQGSIFGFGLAGYRLAVIALKEGYISK